jgi:hypothetical protein
MQVYPIVGGIEWIVVDDVVVDIVVDHPSHR